MGLLSGATNVKRQHLEHLIRAAGAITDSSELIVIGSQAILGTEPNAPESLLVSEEADLYVLGKPEYSVLIDGTIGELSPFHQTFGYYGHGVGPETAILPDGWKSRLVVIRNENTNGISGLCLSPLDIAFSKLAAGRAKDLQYCRELLRVNLVNLEQLAGLIETSDLKIKPALIERLALIGTES